MLMTAAKLFAESSDQPKASPQVLFHDGLRVALAQIAVEYGTLEHNVQLDKEAAARAAHSIKTIDWLTRGLYDPTHPEDIRSVNTELGLIGLTLWDIPAGR
jgi:hypothetical protein